MERQSNGSVSCPAGWRGSLSLINTDMAAIVSMKEGRETRYRGRLLLFSVDILGIRLKIAWSVHKSDSD